MCSLLLAVLLTAPQPSFGGTKTTQLSPQFFLHATLCFWQTGHFVDQCPHAEGNPSAVPPGADPGGAATRAPPRTLWPPSQQRLGSAAFPRVTPAFCVHLLQAGASSGSGVLWVCFFPFGPMSAVAGLPYPKIPGVPLPPLRVPQPGRSQRGCRGR